MSSSSPQTTPPRPAVTQHRPRRKHANTWAWALVTFAVLSLISLVIVIEVVSGGELPSLRPQASWTPAPLQAESPGQPQPSAAEGFSAGRQVVNANSGPVNLRRTPGYQNKPPDDVITAVPSGASGTLIAGPQEVDGLTWWQVRFGEDEGWMAERSKSGVLLLDIAQ